MFIVISTVQSFSCLRDLGSWIQYFPLTNQVITCWCWPTFNRTQEGKKGNCWACSECREWQELLFSGLRSPFKLGNVSDSTTPVPYGNFVQIKKTYPFRSALCCHLLDSYVVIPWLVPLRVVQCTKLYRVALIREGFQDFNLSFPFMALFSLEEETNFQS